MIWLTIAGMALVTYVPRLIPMALGRDVPLPAWIRRWLSFFPYAALGALIFPGILTAIEGRPWISLAAGATAALVALKARNAIIPVLAAVAVALALGAVARA